MKRKLVALKQITQQSHINEYVATFETQEGRLFNYQIVSRRKAKELSLLANNGKQTNVSTVVDAVKVLPYIVKDKNIHIVFIKEFRHAINCYTLSLPAGLVDKGETPKESAIRELEEEIGATTLNIVETAPVSYISEGMTDENMACFSAEVILNKSTSLGVHEDIEIVLVPLSEALEYMNDKEVNLQTRFMVKIFYLEQQLKNII